jgi:hypothetical protein
VTHSEQIREPNLGCDPHVEKHCTNLTTHISLSVSTQLSVHSVVKELCYSQTYKIIVQLIQCFVLQLQIYSTYTYLKKNRSLIRSDFLFHCLGLTLPAVGQTDVLPEYGTLSLYLDCVKVLAAVFHCDPFVSNRQIPSTLHACSVRLRRTWRNH